jgi:hypothetical protein
MCLWTVVGVRKMPAPDLLILNENHLCGNPQNHLDYFCF